MEALKEKILKEGKVREGNILKVDCFLNHQMDIKFLNEVGKEFRKRFEGEKVDKILTIEASGIAIAGIASQYFDYVPVVFAKKTESLNLDKDVYESNVHSFTKKKEAKKGKLSAGLAAASFLLFITAVVLAYLLDNSFGFLVGGVGLFATLLSVYGFIMGLLSFSEEGRSHKTSIIGSISNGLFLIVWIGVYLTGL